MKNKQSIFLKILLIAIFLSFKALSNEQNNKLNKELEDLISDKDKIKADFSDLYDIEPLTEEQNKDKSITNIVRRHQNNKTFDKLKREADIKNFLYKDFKFHHNK